MSIIGNAPFIFPVLKLIIMMNVWTFDMPSRSSYYNLIYFSEIHSVSVEMQIDVLVNQSDNAKNIVKYKEDKT